MPIDPGVETEIKIVLSNVQEARKRILSHGFLPVIPRGFERNSIYDYPGHKLARSGKLLRLREFKAKTTLTLKSAILGDASYKNRREQEIQVSSFQAAADILQGLGLEISFIYEKYREVFSGLSVLLMLDETPIGAFLEIEGDPREIDRAARELEFSKENYLTSSYLQLFREHTPLGNMVFPS